jgi:hypothetical protein
MGPLLKEMRTSPAAAAVNGVLGVGGILGAGMLLALRAARAVRDQAPGEASSRGSLMLYVSLGGLFLVGGAGTMELIAELVEETRRRLG